MFYNAFRCKWLWIISEYNLSSSRLTVSVFHISLEEETIINMFLLTKRIVNGYPGGEKIYKYPTHNEALNLLSPFTDETLL